MWVLFFCFAFVFCGCYPMSRNSLEEEKDPHYIEGNKRLNALDYDGAIKEFERALQTNPNNSAAHRQLGSLYENKKDWVKCIYHYQRHLELNENSNMAGVVRDRMEAAKRQLASTVSFANVPRDFQQQFERFSKTNAFYQQRISQLESELNRRPEYITNFVTNFVTVPTFDQKDRSPAHMTQPTEIVRTETSTAEEEKPPVRDTPTRVEHKTTSTPTPQKTVVRSKPAKKETAPAPVATASRSHVVRPGETLAIIAAKYGISSKTLSAANPGSSKGVRAGQKLVIP